MRLHPHLLLTASLVAVTVSLSAQTAATSGTAAATAPGDANPAAIARLSSQLTLIKRMDLARNECYSLRSYRFKRDDHLGDAVVPSGYSTCLVASSVQQKSADVVLQGRPAR